VVTEWLKAQRAWQISREISAEISREICCLAAATVTTYAATRRPLAGNLD